MRYLNLTQQNTRPKHVIKKTGVNYSLVITCDHTCRGQSSPAMKCFISAPPAAPSLSVLNCVSHPMCPTLALLRVHQRLWGGCSLKWLNLNWHMKCHLQIKPGWRKPFRTFMSLFSLSLSSFPSHATLKRACTSFTILVTRGKQLLPERCLQVHTLRAGRICPHFPSPPRIIAQTEVPPQVRYPVRHKPKLFWHISTDLCWKNGHWAIKICFAPLFSRQAAWLIGPFYLGKQILGEMYR